MRKYIFVYVAMFLCFPALAGGLQTHAIHELKQVLEAQKNASYEHKVSTTVYRQAQARQTQSHSLHYKISANGNTYQRIWLTSSPFDGVMFLIFNTKESAYFPQEKKLFEGGRLFSDLQTHLGHPFDALDLIPSNFVQKITRSENRIQGVDALQLRFEPRVKGSTPTYVFWVDPTRHVILKEARFWGDDKRAYFSKFVSTVGPLKSELKVFSLPFRSKPTVRGSSAFQSQEAAQQTLSKHGHFLPRLEYIPAGFRLKDIRLMSFEQGTQSVQTYTNGLSHFFVLKGLSESQWKSLSPGLWYKSQQWAMHSPYNFVPSQGSELMVFGDLSASMLKKIQQGLQDSARKPAPNRFDNF